MKTIKLSNGVTINVSETEYKSYIAQTKALKDLEKNSNKLDAKTPTKSVSATYSDYVLRALKSGAELLFNDTCVSIVSKGDRVVAENRGFNRAMYQGIAYSMKDFGAVWCGDRDKKVFTYAFPTISDALGYIYYQLNSNHRKGLSDKEKKYNEVLKANIKNAIQNNKIKTLKDIEKVIAK